MFTIKKNTAGIFFANFIGLAFVILYSDFAGIIKELDPLSDLHNYQNFFDLSSSSTSPLLDFDLGFSFFTWIVSKFFSFQNFLTLIFFIVWAGLFFAIKTITKNNFLAAVLSTLLITLYPPYISITNIVLRQGLASAFALYFLKKIHEKEEINFHVFFIYMFILSFHASAIIFICACIIAHRSRVKFIFLFWLIMSAAYIANLSGQISIFSADLIGINLEVLNAFNRSGIDYQLGFKIGFFVVNSMPAFLLLVLWLTRLNLLRDICGFDSFILKLFWLSNSFAMMFSLSTFNDRMFMWSWIILPIILLRIVKSIKIFPTRSLI